jgi:hypothetical protein
MIENPDILGKNRERKNLFVELSRQGLQQKGCPPLEAAIAAS